MASYDNALPIIPVAVPLPVTIDDADTPVVQSRPPLATANAAHQTSNYQLPSSRRNGEFAPVPESRIQQLMAQGFTRGHATSLAQTIKNFPLRIWVVDNSGSMQKTDGHRFVETKRSRDVRVVSCSRWNEIKDCIEYHTQMAAALEAPTTFRMLNDPACGPNSQQFGIAESSLDPLVLQEEVDRSITIMKTAQPGGVTPLVKHVWEIAQSVRELEPQLRADGCRVAIILATDGLPTDERGYGGRAIQEQFVEALRGLEGLPVWVVVRLCTDEESVVTYYNELDSQLELSLEVLDDFLEEAKEIDEHNPWLNYALPLHRLRELGYHDRVFDMMDERPFTHEELRQFCTMLLVDKSPSDELPDPSADWDEFSKTVKNLLAKQQGQWNPIKRKVAPWIDMRKMDKIYGEKRWYHFW
eukprot:CAMPEP_0172552070 /NCGR_PEP_ID=MMETSP1067-20121228/43612_1 /TAXON_ID=265564 ORGANISM="Thalassiosira punctigera, Strain Tpunct2005C2" /NCGR_SAMPLE_ID=MMETSP1067 /ASSEMBLY_ACC=CAM_ASM_000444 /LENGTH=412 /DNA_ID=CAMNT_0013339985 /DNA_START=219 /DNA_END=1454 /DNA_ORIENTATION=+